VDLPFRFSYKNADLQNFLPSNACNILRSCYTPSFDDPNNVWWRKLAMKILDPVASSNETESSHDKGTIAANVHGNLHCCNLLPALRYDTKSRWTCKFYGDWLYKSITWIFKSLASPTISSLSYYMGLEALSIWYNITTFRCLILNSNSRA